MDPRALASITEEVAKRAQAFEEAIETKNFTGALSFWTFASDAERQQEEIQLRSVFSSQRAKLSLDIATPAPDGKIAVTTGTLITINEPRGTVAQWSLAWQRNEAGVWSIFARNTFDPVDGLVHLTLDPQGFVATGQSIVLEDFRLDVRSGSFFMNTQEAGPTALVFVGEGRVTFSPPSEAEQGQMRIFCGAPSLVTDVDVALVRLHPADLNRVLQPGTFAPDPQAGQRLKKARDYFAEHIDDAFVLEAAVEGSPWWVLPGVSDASVAFESKKHGTLTYTLSTQDSEGISLFNRDTRRQVSVYPRRGSVSFSDDTEAFVDTRSHALNLAINPETGTIDGESTMTLDFRVSISTFRLRLDDDLRVISIRSKEGGRHLFFRIRDQNTVLVSLGSLAGRVGELNLTVRYAGRLEEGPIESETLQSQRISDIEEPAALLLDPVHIYTRRRAFYPQIGEEDYATWTLKVTTPAAWTAVSSGELLKDTVTGTENQARREMSFSQQVPGKYIAIAVSRLRPMLQRKTRSGVSLDVFGQARLRREAQKNADQAEEILSFFETLFGPIPYPLLRIALVETPVPGGHSPPGLVIVQQRPALFRGTLRDDPAAFWDVPGFFLAHELAHQWWGQGVTPRSYHDRWVSEGFAQYAAALYVRHSRGEAAFASVLKKMATWAKRLTDAGPVSLGNRVGHIKNDAQANRAVIYDKGALVLDLVRRVLGDVRFAEALQQIQTDYRQKRVSTSAIRAAFAARDARLEVLFDQFLSRTALPSVGISAAAGGVRLTTEGYKGPLPVVVDLAGERRVVIAQDGTSDLLNVDASKVTIDPDSILLARVRR